MSNKRIKKHALLINMGVLLIILVVIAGLELAFYLVRNNHPDHSQQRAAMQKVYMATNIPSSLKLTSSKWFDDSAPPEASTDYGWRYSYRPTESRQAEYQALEQAFKAQGLESGRATGNSVPNSILYGEDQSHHLWLVAIFLPQQNHADSQAPINTVEISVNPEQT